METTHNIMTRLIYNDILDMCAVQTYTNIQSIIVVF